MFLLLLEKILCNFNDFVIQSPHMAKRLSQDIKNKTPRSRKTKKRLATKKAMLESRKKRK